MAKCKEKYFQNCKNLHFALFTEKKTNFEENFGRLRPEGECVNDHCNYEVVTILIIIFEISGSLHGEHEDGRLGYCFA
jgi:hypothetical protein